MTELLAPAEHQAPQERDSGRDTLRFLLTKIGGGLVSVLLVIVLGFFLFRVLPGDPVTTMTQTSAAGGNQSAYPTEAT